MSYGSTPYGGGSGVRVNLVTRTRRFLRSGPNATTLSGIQATQLQGLHVICDQIAESFSLTGVGEILDRLGAILQRPRPAGYSDADFRILLAVQVELVLSSTASDETLLAIVERVTGVLAAEYMERSPAEVVIAAVVPHERVELLLSLLVKAKAGHILLTLVEITPGVAHLVGDLVADTYADPGVGDLVADTYADAYVTVRVHR